jgi:hypothetical protein
VGGRRCLAQGCRGWAAAPGNEWRASRFCSALGCCGSLIFGGENAWVLNAVRQGGALSVRHGRKRRERRNRPHPHPPTPCPPGVRACRRAPQPRRPSRRGAPRRAGRQGPRRPGALPADTGGQEGAVRRRGRRAAAPARSLPPRPAGRDRRWMAQQRLPRPHGPRPSGRGPEFARLRTRPPAPAEGAPARAAPPAPPTARRRGSRRSPRPAVRAGRNGALWRGPKWRWAPSPRPPTP